jgi:hypothetical protein
MNYHLKVFGDLIVKDERTGRYSLGEKGTLAVALLSKFQTATSVTEARKSLVTGFMLVALLVGVILLSYFTQYVRGFSGIEQTLYGIGWAEVGLFAAWLFSRKSLLHSLLQWNCSAPRM